MKMMHFSRPIVKLPRCLGERPPGIDAACDRVPKGTRSHRADEWRGWGERASTRISTVAAWKVIHYPTDAHWNLDAQVANPRFTPDVQTVMSPSQLAVPFPREEYHLSAPETRSVRALINARFRCRE